MGIFLDDHSVAEPYGSLGFVNVFIAEVGAMLEACQWLGHDPGTNCNIIILTDSQTVIKALHIVGTGPIVVGQCEDAFNSLSRMLKVILRWVLSHTNIKEN